jgi:hypothetical protein
MVLIKPLFSATALSTVYDPSSEALRMMGAFFSVAIFGVLVVEYQKRQFYEDKVKYRGGCLLFVVCFSDV